MNTSKWKWWKSASRDQNLKLKYLANKAAAWLFYIALISGFTTLGVWLWQGKEIWTMLLERMVTVMIIACPACIGLGNAFGCGYWSNFLFLPKNGLLIRNRTAFEKKSRKITTVISIKRVQLTKGNFVVNQFKKKPPPQLQMNIKMKIFLKIGSITGKGIRTPPLQQGIVTKKHKEEELEFWKILSDSWNPDGVKVIQRKKSRGNSHLK